MGRRDPRRRAAVHYAKAVEELDDDDLSMLAAWHASLEVGHPIANKEFLLGAFAAPRPAPPRGAADRGRLQGRRRVRGRRQRGAGARHGAALAVAASGCWSWPRKRSSCTAGTDWAPTTSRLRARAARSWRRAAPAATRRPCAGGPARGAGRHGHPASPTATPPAVRARPGAADRGGHARGLRARPSASGAQASAFVERTAPARQPGALPARASRSATATGGRSPTSGCATAAS